ncbi:MAG: prepilin peptidase [Gammaproteobacteria bacterium]|nr:prepilin peptidase [Gammaproteobacteria bacterium]
MLENASWTAAAALVGAVAVATATLYSDAKRREISHGLVVGLAALWLLAALLAPAAMGAAAWQALACGAGALGVGYVAYLLGWLGAGDGKLLGVLALWMGPRDLGLWLLGTAALGLALILIALARPGGDFRTRGLPFAWAMAPPAATLLAARALALGGA